MRRWLSIYLLMGWCCASSAAAQEPPPEAPPQRQRPVPGPRPEPEPDVPPDAPLPDEPETSEPEPASEEGAPEPEPEEPELEEPELEEPELEEPEPVEPEAGPEPEPAVPNLEIPTPEEMEERLAEGLPPPQPSDEWVAPAPVFTLHGYMRMRGELMDSFWLGRRAVSDFTSDPNIPLGVRAGQGPDPFTRFRPIERRRAPDSDRAPAGLPCVDEDTLGDGTCDVSTLQFANMRLRLSPQLNVSEDVRVKMTFDVFDNLVAGTPPATFYGMPAMVGGNGQLVREAAETSAFAGTLVPPNDNNLGDSIRARRAWAEVRNRDLGELRFGRMPQHWGLGMYYNAGNEIDDDLSTDLDRVLGITKIAGLYISASYDFVAEGLTLTGTDNRPLDQSQLDDVDQFTFSVAKRHSDEELASALERGELVLNGGVQFSLRNQDALYRGVMGDEPSPLVELEATTYTTDLWLLLRYRGLRLEAEAAWVTGGMDNLAEGGGEHDIDQLGYALEAEYRLLEDKLGLYFYHGLASGDGDVEGLSSDADFITQLGTGHDGTISTFRFHPSYRVDLILWRNIMRQITAAYYFRPGVSYDFIRSDFGQLLGARLDVIWSRAAVPIQTWGNDDDLGVEIDIGLYFRSEDGPDFYDGFHAMLQYGVLFPMAGLGYLHQDTDLETAQTLRLLLGVVF